MKSFIKAFIWKRSQEITRTELHSDKSVTQSTYKENICLCTANILNKTVVDSREGVVLQLEGLSGELTIARHKNHHVTKC
jgi:hypothetical protein